MMKNLKKMERIVLRKDTQDKEGLRVIKSAQIQVFWNNNERHGNT